MCHLQHIKEQYKISAQKQILFSLQFISKIDSCPFPVSVNIWVKREVNLAEVKIPEGVIGIGREAFYGCTSLRSVTVPSTVQFIGDNAIGLRTNRIDNSIEPVPGFIIFGKKDSAAERYARGKGIDFIDTEATPSGDVNMDGFVDSSDASQVLSEYAELATGGKTTLSPAQRYLADVDGNGETDSADASEILIIYAENATA